MRCSLRCRGSLLGAERELPQHVVGHTFSLGIYSSFFHCEYLSSCTCDNFDARTFSPSALFAQVLVQVQPKHAVRIDDTLPWPKFCPVAYRAPKLRRCAYTLQNIISFRPFTFCDKRQYVKYYFQGKLSQEDYSRMAAVDDTDVMDDDEVHHLMMVRSRTFLMGSISSAFTGWWRFRPKPMFPNKTRPFHAGKIIAVRVMKAVKNRGKTKQVWKHDSIDHKLLRKGISCCCIQKISRRSIKSFFQNWKMKNEKRKLKKLSIKFVCECVNIILRYANIIIY